MQLVAVGATTDDVQGGEPDEMREQHHPGDQRHAQSQEYLGELHVAPAALFDLVVLDQELLELAGAEVEHL